MSYECVSMCSSVLHLLRRVLLDTVVDVTQPGSCQDVGGLLVDQRVEVSLDLQSVGESGLKFRPSLHCEPQLLVVNGEPLCRC